MNRNPFLSAALTAVRRGWFVFPLVPGGKTPLVRSWEQRATTDTRQVCRWWATGVTSNVGVATGKSGLVVIDLDDGRGDTPPERFAGARNGRDALGMLAAAAGAEIPTDTYAVATPGGIHLYFRAPADLVLRNTAGSLGWKVDSRAQGGCCVAAGSVREQGVYRVTRHGVVAELPVWLARALTPLHSRSRDCRWSCRVTARVPMCVRSWRAKRVRWPPRGRVPAITACSRRRALWAGWSAAVSWPRTQPGPLCSMPPVVISGSRTAPPTRCIERLMTASAMADNFPGGLLARSIEESVLAGGRVCC